jgi:hypothetical protein
MNKEKMEYIIAGRRFDRRSKGKVIKINTKKFPKWYYNCKFKISVKLKFGKSHWLRMTRVNGRIRCYPNALLNRCDKFTHKFKYFFIA